MIAVFLRQTCICYAQLSVLQLLWYFSRSKCTLTVLISVISVFVINERSGICFKALKHQRHFVCLSVTSSISPIGAYYATTDCEVRKILRVTYQRDSLDSNLLGSPTFPITSLVCLVLSDAI